jgi:hypothetical protein
MSPEQARGESKFVGPQADVWALGVMLHEALTGTELFTGTLQEVFAKVLRSDPSAPSTVVRSVPRDLDLICLKCLAQEPHERYATAKEVADDLDRLVRGEPISVRRPGPLERAARWVKRNKVVSGAAVAVFLALTSVAWAMYEGEKQTRAEQQKTLAERDRVIEEKKRTAAALEEVQARIEQIETQNELIKAQYLKIESARAVAVGRYDKAVAAYNVLIADIDKKLADRAGLQELRKTLLWNAAEGLKQLVAGEGKSGADRTLVAAYRQLGELYLLLGETGMARANFQLAVDRAGDVLTAAEQGASAADRRAASRDLGRSLYALSGILLVTGDTKGALGAINKAITRFTALAEDPTDAAAQQDLAGAKARRAKILHE